MPIEVKTSFQKIEEYDIKVEVTMSYAQWKTLLSHIDKSWAEPMASFIGSIKSVISGLEKNVLFKDIPVQVCDATMPQQTSESPEPKK